MCYLRARRIEGSGWLGLAACLGHLIQGADRPRAEHNGSVGAPCSTASHYDIGDVLGGSSCNLNSLQLVWDSEKTDGPAVGRPERVRSIFRSGQRLSVKRIQ